MKNTVLIAILMLAISSCGSPFEEKKVIQTTTIQNNIAPEKQINNDYESEAKNLILKLETKIISDNITEEQAERLREKVKKYLENKYNISLGKRDYRKFSQVSPKSSSVKTTTKKINDTIIVQKSEIDNISISDGGKINVTENGIHAHMEDGINANIGTGGINMKMGNGDYMKMGEDGIDVNLGDMKIKIGESGINFGN